jgi:DNA-binding winged helix-turn-helix (wHTH) protein
MAEVAPLAFGEFVLDPSARTLSRGSEALHLTPKAFDLLWFLASRRPAAASKDDIHAALWPGVFVADVNVAALIFELRAALGESARASRFIRTVHGFGYAFAADATAPRTSRFRLILDGQEIALPEGETLVGRGDGCGIRIESAKVSRRHARLVVNGPIVSVEDCGSSNGSIVPASNTRCRRMMAMSCALALWLRCFGDPPPTK